jgi:hypothetical protein
MLPSHRRCECGPDILDLPMANTPEMVAEFVENVRSSIASSVSWRWWKRSRPSIAWKSSVAFRGVDAIFIGPAVEEARTALRK